MLAVVSATLLKSVLGFFKQTYGGQGTVANHSDSTQQQGNKETEI